MSEDTRVYFVGDIKKFEVQNITKDGTAWALTGATLYLVKPDGTVLSPKTATQVDSVTWGYVTVSGDMDTSGVWRRYWRLTDGSSTETYGDFQFFVRSVA